MVKKKRWGKKYEDKRDWKAYNQSLINRGEFYINPIFLDTWIDEIKEMNSSKIGQPYMYPNSLIEFLAILYQRGFDYRSLEGILRGLSKRLGTFPVIVYSQIRRRIRNLKPKFSAKKDKLIVGSDGTGLKVGNRGEWVREKWAVKRGWIKVVILGDTEGNVVDIRIGNEDLNENSAGRGMLRKNYKNINKFIGDGLYDAKDNFRLLDQLGVEPVIKIRKNASTKSNGCMARKKQVISYKEKGYKKWAKENGYGLRWPATEGIFSTSKRMFGESVRSHKIRNMYHEAKLKLWAYQKLKECS
ncbi:MAG: IS5 family transposase [Nanoarchaeota archaeon]|nr:IS5 family transposase [Nanoarchaeota archaeon]MBU4241908.1 IS5 family transposase [Nanoarchaeota archaeon]MBU4456592.1 IS5 family transposase [Nanoarchaeota archaeon]MCG2719616.1 IS5 family transposase [Nanoarchaeota archaeon]